MKKLSESGLFFGRQESYGFLLFYFQEEWKNA